MAGCRVSLSRSIWLFAVLLTGSGLIHVDTASAQIADWTVHTSMRRTASIASQDDTVWVATNGGVYSYVPSTSETILYTAAQGLSGVDSLTIATDVNGRHVWVGHIDGVLDRIDTWTGTIRRFSDIARADQFTSRKINKIVSRPDTLYVATGFGVVVFDALKLEVIEAYTRLGTVAPATATHDIIFAPNDGGNQAIWVASNGGVASAPLSSPNLQDPARWTVEQPPNRRIRSLEMFGGRLLVGTDSDLYVRTSSNSFMLLFDGDGFSELVRVGTEVIGVQRFSILRIPEQVTGVVKYNLQGMQDPVGLVQLSSGDVWVGDDQIGLAQFEPPTDSSPGVLPTIATFYPPGPFNNSVGDLFAEPGGAIWTAEIQGSRSGIGKRSDDGVWTGFNPTLNVELQNVDYMKRVRTDAEGAAWVATENKGIVRIAPDGAISFFDETNSTIESAVGFPGFMPTEDVWPDEDGNVWVTTRATTTPLHVRTPDGSWHGVGPLVGQGLNLNSTAYQHIFIDAFDQKWIVVRDERNTNLGRGLAVLETGPDPADVSDYAFRFFDTRGAAGQGLPSTQVTSVVEDSEGLVWVGTSEGLAYFLNSGVVARDPSAVAIWPQRAERNGNPFLLLGLPINDLAVDPANRLWVATNEGVRVIQSVEGGFEELLVLDKDNSLLLSDVVLSVAVDEDAGEVYFATDRGLVSVSTDAVRARLAVGDLFIYPNPVRVGQGDVQIVVDGLVDETDMSIVTVTGEVIAQLQTRGGRATWNGRDTAGGLVPSGMYIVTAVARNGEGTAVGKVAVIR